MAGALFIFGPRFERRLQSQSRLLRADCYELIQFAPQKETLPPSATLVCRPLVTVLGRYIRGILRQRYEGHVCLRADNPLLKAFHVPACGSFQKASGMENALEAFRSIGGKQRSDASKQAKSINLPRRKMNDSG